MGAVIEHWEYRKLPPVRFVGLEFFCGSDDWATTRQKVISVLDKMPEYASGFDYDLTLTHHFGRPVDTERNHDYIGRFMKADSPVPDGFIYWDFVSDARNTSCLTFCSQFAFSVFAGDHDAMHRHNGFDVNALYDITRNIILEEKITIPYPEFYWTAEVQFDRADGTVYNPEGLYNGENKRNEVRCGWLFSTYSK
ncbi:MAG: hypothetical protein KH354_05495 [Clostridiales bacterium]|nr:hypothetical protein [Clostridiales bacterium]